MIDVVVTANRRDSRVDVELDNRTKPHLEELANRIARAKPGVQLQRGAGVQREFEIVDVHRLGVVLREHSAADDGEKQDLAKHIALVTN